MQIIKALSLITGFNSYLNSFNLISNIQTLRFPGINAQFIQLENVITVTKNKVLPGYSASYWD